MAQVAEPLAQGALAQGAEALAQGALEQGDEPLAQGAINVPQGDKAYAQRARQQEEASAKTKDNVEAAFNKIKGKLNAREYVYYILGPITQFDRDLIKMLLDEGIKVHAFIQGGIEKFPAPPPPPWASSLLGLVPANAGMDFENFYGFFAEDDHANLKVYVQFTNMAKPLPANVMLQELWKEDNPVMRQFLIDLEKDDRGHLFAKLWAFYFRTSSGGPWQHDPIEAINSLGALVGDGIKDDYYHKMVMSGRHVKYNTQNLDGLISEQGVFKGGAASQDSREIIANLLDHIPPEKTKEQYEEYQRYRFNQFIRLLRRSFEMDPPTPTEDDDYVDQMIGKFQQKFLAGISIEILDPDNLFAAEIVKLISGEPEIFCHHQFYPDNVTINCRVDNKTPKILSLMEIPKTIIDKLIEGPENKLSDVRKNKKPDGTEANPVLSYDLLNGGGTAEYYNLGGFLGAGLMEPAIPNKNIPERKFEPKYLMYSQFYGEHLMNNVDCADAELNFMVKVMERPVMHGQMLYGNTDNCLTFSATNLLHPATQMHPDYFLNKEMKKEDFVNTVIREIANTTALSSVRVYIRTTWSQFRGGYIKPRKIKKHKSIKIKKHKSRKNKSRK